MFTMRQGVYKLQLTNIAILARDLSNGITNFVAHSSICLSSQCLQELLSNSGRLVFGDSQKQINGLTVVKLSSFGGDASEK